MSKILYLSLMLSLAFLKPQLALALDTTQHEEVTNDTREPVATEILRKEPDVVAMYVKGLCCPSCAIGVRIKISKLDFVDTDRFNKGVGLDAKHQIASVAIKAGHTADPKQLEQAVTDAGYDLKTIYTLKDDKLQIQEFSVED